MDEIELAKAVQQGDEIAFKKLFELYYKRILAYILTFSKDEDLSTDISQQVFIALWEHKEKLDTSRSPKSYLFAIAYNKYIDHCKTIKKKDSFLNELKKESLNQLIE